MAESFQQYFIVFIPSDLPPVQNLRIYFCSNKSAQRLPINSVRVLFLLVICDESQVL